MTMPLCNQFPFTFYINKGQHAWNYNKQIQTAFHVLQEKILLQYLAIKQWFFGYWPCWLLWYRHVGLQKIYFDQTLLIGVPSINMAVWN